MPGSGSTHVGASLWSVVGALKHGVAAKDSSAARPWAGPACGARAGVGNGSVKRAGSSQLRRAEAANIS
jgi:hypothetical protein